MPPSFHAVPLKKQETQAGLCFYHLRAKAGLIHVLALGQAGLAVVPVLEDRRHGDGGVVYKGTLAFHSTN